MAFNCCYRLESQKRSCLAAFLAGRHSPFLENNLLHLLLHVHLYADVHLTAAGRTQTAPSSDENVSTAPPFPQ